MEEGMALGFISGGEQPGLDSRGLTELAETLAALIPEEVSPERAAAMVFYTTEHQLERWAELLEFFSGETAALIKEAWEATADDESSGGHE